MESKVCCIVAAGGSGKRMGSAQNKLFLELDGVPLIAHTLSRLQASTAVDEIIISAREEDFLYLSEIVEEFLISKVKKIVKGGETRGESVLSAKGEISPDTQIVMIHDGARPFVSDEIIRYTVDAAKIHGSAACGVKPKCTLKAVENGFISGTINRDNTVEIQTPQVFKKEIFDKMYSLDAETIKTATDDCILAEKTGTKIFLTEGSYKNIKITTPEDLEVAESFLRRY